MQKAESPKNLPSMEKLWLSYRFSQTHSNSLIIIPIPNVSVKIYVKEKMFFIASISISFF